MCEYCRNKYDNKLIVKGEEWEVTITDGELEICFVHGGDGTYMQYIDIEYCPKCGRELVDLRQGTLSRYDR